MSRAKLTYPFKESLGGHLRGCTGLVTKGRHYQGRDGVGVLLEETIDPVQVIP